MKYIITVLSLILTFTTFAQKGTTVPKTAPTAPVQKSSPAYTKPKPVTTPTTSYPPGTIILEVNHETIGCEFDKSKSCLLVREKGRSEYEILDMPISGFDFEPGNAYTVAVKQEPSGSYSLFKIIDKKFIKNTSQKYTPPTETNTGSTATAPAPTSAISDNHEKKVVSNDIYHSPLDKKWYLRTLLEKEGTFIISENNSYWIEFNSFMDRFKGNSFCNTFEGIFKSDLTTLLKVDQLNMGKEECYQSRLEDILYSNLMETDRFEIRGTTLYLSKQWKILMTFDMGYDSSPFASKQEEKTSAKLPEKANSNQHIQQEIKTAVTEPNTTPSINNEKPAITENAPINSGPANNVELEAMKKELEELKKQLLAKEEAEKQETQAKEKAQQEELAKLQQEKQKNPITQPEISTPNKQQQKPTTFPQPAQKPSIQTNSEPKTAPLKQSVKPESQEGTSGQTGSNISSNNPNLLLPDDIAENTILFMKGNSLDTIEYCSMMANSEGNKLSLSIFGSESSIRFKANEIPRFYVKIPNNIIYGEYLKLFQSDTKKDSRETSVRPQKNRIEFNATKIKSEIYEIIIPNNLASGEYVFLFTGKMEVRCFGITK